VVAAASGKGPDPLKVFLIICFAYQEGNRSLIFGWDTMAVMVTRRSRLMQNPFSILRLKPGMIIRFQIPSTASPNLRMEISGLELLEADCFGSVHAVRPIPDLTKLKD
jgi:hypothetical protein